MRPGNKLVQCRNCTAIILKSEAINYGWLCVMLNTWQCWFCSHHPREQLAIKSNDIIEIE
jgi:hypothetical protein